MRAGTARRFETLDLLRGVAAVAVFTLHFAAIFGTPELLPHAYLAVDLFFVLSGFVLAHAYGSQLAEGDSALRFMWHRFLRLYPLYLIATIAGAAAIVGEMLADGLPARTFGQWLFSLASGLLFLPGSPYNAGSSSWIFPALFPAWSLFWELMANLLYAAVAPRLGSRALLLILGSGLALLIATGARYGTLDAGPRWGDVLGGGGRVIWSFFAGVALQRLPSRPSFKRLGLPLAVLLIAIMAQPRGGWHYDVVVVVLVFPLFVLLGARTAQALLFGSWLGYTSYGLYVVHVPLLTGIHGFAKHISGSFPEFILMSACLAVALAVASRLTRSVEVPLRSSISRIGAIAFRRSTAARA